MILVTGQEQQAEQLLSEAIYQEEVNGDLDKAIKAYQLIINQYPDNRNVSAEAYFHMGMCYEKLGKQEAMKAYQEVIRNYSDQKEVVARARERLSRLEQPSKKSDKPEGIKIRQIWKQPYLDFLGTVSFDGRSLAYIYWGEGDVAVHDLITGEDRILTHEADLEDSTHFAQSPVISKDGSKIAYYWWKPYHTFDLRLIDVNDPSPSLLLHRQEGVEVYPRTWLSDNELIVIRQDRNTETTKFTTFNIVDGTSHDLKTFEGRKWVQLACSPDEKYIAYDFENETDNGNFDINLLLADGDNEIPLIKYPANDRVLGWVPGRKDFLFISDRSGTWDLWAIPLDNGKPSGPAKRIYTDIGEVEPMGFTQNGNCYFGFSRRNFYTSIAPFDAETGDIKVESGKSLKGSNFWLIWSPDGQYLAYINIEDRNTLQLTVQDLKTGREQKLADNTLLPLGAIWSPDGNSIMVVGFEKSKFQTNGYSGGIYLVDVKTGQTTEILLLSDYEFNVPEDDHPPLSIIEWSADGKSIFYLFFKDRLVKHNLETGEDKILYSHSNFEPYVLDLSPNGNILLFGIQNRGEKSRLLTIPAEGGKVKEVCTAQETNDVVSAFWSPDGKYIYFTERPEETNLWRIPEAGGKPQKIWSSENRADIYCIHPDGNHIAFSIRERTTEVRVIENLVQELERLDDMSE